MTKKIGTISTIFLSAVMMGMVFIPFTPAMAGVEPPKTIVVDADGLVGHSSPRNTAQCDGTRIAVETSIQAAIDGANPGDTIIVCPATYNQAVVVDESGMTVKGIAKPIVNGSPAFTITADGVHLTGFIVTSSGTSCIVVDDKDDVRIHGIITSGCTGDGIEADGERFTISGNNLSGNDDNGLRCDVCIDSVIQGNTANDNDADGFKLAIGSDNNVVKGNTANDNDDFGFNDDGEGNEVRQNKCSGNTDGGSDPTELCKPQGFI